MMRAVIISATIAALLCILLDHPAPVKSPQVDYCKITYKGGGKHPLTGELVTGWVQGYGPCYLQDEYKNI